MTYGRFFRRLRETRGFTQKGLAKLSGFNRGPVCAVEAGQVMTFQTIVPHMVAMGYDYDSPEMKTMALLWAEQATGCSITRDKVLGKTKKFVERANAENNLALRDLIGAIGKYDLSSEEIQNLIFIVEHPRFLDVISACKSV